MNWDDVRTALAIERGGTLSAGARALGIDQTTASRRLARLERSLGARLFDRIDGRMVPPPAGRRALERAAPMADAAAAVAEGVRDVDAALSGPVRLTSLPSFVTGYLAPRLAGFTGRHPGITVELIGVSENLHLGRREADLAIRFSRPTAGAVLGSFLPIPGGTQIGWALGSMLGAPTQRSQAQTVRTARRLHRGGGLYEDDEVPSA